MSGEGSTSQYDVIVVGAGVGGLTAGALLAKAGKKVLVAEREQQAGGYARGLRRGPYEFDTGPCRIRLLKTVRAELAFYDLGEYRRLVEAAVATDPRIELLALLEGDAGLRRGEAIAVEWTDVDLRRRMLHVQRSEWDGHVTAPKGGRSRRVPLTARLAEALKAHRHLKALRALCHEDGEGIGKKAVHAWMAKAQRRAVLPATGAFHILRHTFCSRLAMQGATAKGIQELAGHQDLATTQRYMHLSPAHKDAAIRLLDRRPTDEAFGDSLETGSAVEQKQKNVE